MKQKKEKSVLVYIICGSIKEAKNIGKILVKENLAACVNILGKTTSIFRWEGELEEQNEVVMIAKTQKKLIHRLVSLIKENHSYEYPCILELPIQGGNSDFLNWIESETI